METQQNSTKVISTTTGNVEDTKPLTDKQLLYIDFTAVSGLMTDDDGNLQNMKVGEFANHIGVERTTLHWWKTHIPDFWGKVRDRRMAIGSQARTNKVMNGLYLRAAKGDAEQVKIWLGIFDNWQPPAQRHDVKVSDTWASLVRNKQEVLEGEVVDGGTTDTAGNAEATSALPEESN